MNSEFNIAEYMSGGIENIINNIIKASFKNPRETAFMVKYMLASKEAKKKREAFEANGQDIPSFLISSITSTCNLFCKGCYARANKACGEGLELNQMSAGRWGEVFEEAKELGIPFILLAGGEPLMRREVIEKAAKVKEIMFPIFTNGTMLDEEYIKLLDKNRNLVPILSIEGDRDQTDDRRGRGTYDTLMNVMDNLKKKGILYGASVTVTTENINTVTSKEFFDKLYEKGCRAMVFVEYVPVTEATRNIAPTDKERDILEAEQSKLREMYEDAIFLSFPGDEKYTGGCLAAGRGFFHINTNGGAEPCPFSPFSDMNLKNCTLLEALKSPLFQKLKEYEILSGEHSGGCVLFEKEAEVKKLLADN
ncbi:radical SAM protein [Clostridium sp. YIM B02505]|uniref:Radical SAM protein n=1 Tax=Clostridium yunnanense TaxID=2800325 RepID=A0ABS1EUJ1_9CLOT|nr:radical SAM protein [Clostridium yunnanense]MBK1813041.1 radical SAM protein [Clostridium yunnanense]